MNGISLRIAGWLVAAAALLASGCGQGVQGVQEPATASSEAALQSHSKGPKLTPQTSGTTANLIAVSAVDSRVVWVAGAGGTFGVTTNGGHTWRTGVVPGTEGQQMRDVQGVSEKVAYLLQIPVSDVARVFKTTDGGKTWTAQVQGADVNEFFDCFAFWDARSGIMMVDSINGRFPVRRTLDGRTWQDIGDRLPAALPGESGFASSGTCAATQGHSRGWITTGVPPATPDGRWTTRVLRTTDRGQTWRAATAPITAGPEVAGGGFSIAFRDAEHGILGGGDLNVPAAGVVPNFARSKDGGKTWSLGTAAPIVGAIYGLAYADQRRSDDDDDQGEQDRGHDQGDDHGGSIRVVATAPTGTAWSGDEGKTWTSLPSLSGLWAVDFANEQTGWLVGTKGQIVRIDF
jgi:photosystem II stability/assembly factor-like uncharacterized protein